MPRTRYTLYEVDLNTATRGERLGTYDDKALAHRLAKELARQWCQDEEPQPFLIAKGIDAYAGESDFAVAIWPHH